MAAGCANRPFPLYLDLDDVLPSWPDVWVLRTKTDQSLRFCVEVHQCSR